MNRRQWKKACKKAAVELQRRWPGQFEISLAEGDETVYAPRAYIPPGKPRAGFNRRMWRLEFTYTSVPRGTPIIWTCDYWGECDCETALHVLEQTRMCEEIDWEAMWKTEEQAAASTPAQ